MEQDLAALKISEIEDDEIQIVRASTTPKPLYDLCLVGCFVTVSVVHFPVMHTTLANLWHPLEVFKFLVWGISCFSSGSSIELTLIGWRLVPRGLSIITW
ncbi:hypothetical protein ES332_D07G174800v1 [Gossypium tomentosum]|uniref:Uncharacterized protein n=1 Tax=Gossypium tomentosum TaxID=34277 RepID=A0A5D2K7S5_GOSTO|nr:hypothetical protein ES332_D07G174800v1 [Gossypium tomentosum]